MANATLVITATLTNGALTRDIELQLCKRVADLALENARSAGGTAASGSVTEPGTTASAAWSYSAVAPK